MSKVDPLDEEKSVRLRQRLWGAAVLIALLVIFLPLVLDGSGSESQYRRVERLRAEPPRVVDEEGNVEPVAAVVQNTPDPAPTDAEVAVTPQRVDIQDVEPAANPQTAPSRPRPSAENAPVKPEKLQAWVVQAGSFQDEVNALAVRDRLRRAGFPSFVTPNDAVNPLYRVRVGPMISLQRAERSRDKVMRLLDREAIVVGYP